MATCVTDTTWQGMESKGTTITAAGPTNISWKQKIAIQLLVLLLFLAFIFAYSQSDKIFIDSIVLYNWKFALPISVIFNSAFIQIAIGFYLILIGTIWVHEVHSPLCAPLTKDSNVSPGIQLSELQKISVHVEGLMSLFIQFFSHFFFLFVNRDSRSNFRG